MRSFCGAVSASTTRAACSITRRVAIHFTHRIGAVVAAFVLGYVSWLAIRTGQSRAVRAAGGIVGAVLVTQLVVGPVMVMKTFPLWLATAHNAVASLLLLSVVALARFLFVPKRAT